MMMLFMHGKESEQDDNHCEAMSHQ